MPHDTLDDLLAPLGRTDVYLLDQFMRGRLPVGTRVLDAGCGSGRNLDLFLRAGCEVWALDQSVEAVTTTLQHAQEIGCPIPPERALVGEIEGPSVPAGKFDVVLSIAVLHFARDHEHWRAMIDGLWRALAPDGTLFARLTSSIGIERFVVPAENGRYRLGDGSTRYLVTLEQLRDVATELGAVQLDPVKTVNVENLRAMTTWVLHKPA